MSQAITERTPNYGVMRAKGAAAFFGVSQATFWRWVKKGKIPRGVRLSTRCTVWRRDALEQALEQILEQAAQETA